MIGNSVKGLTLSIVLILDTSKQVFWHIVVETQIIHNCMEYLTVNNLKYIMDISILIESICMR